MIKNTIAASLRRLLFKDDQQQEHAMIRRQRDHAAVKPDGQEGDHHPPGSSGRTDIRPGRPRPLVTAAKNIVTITAALLTAALTTACGASPSPERGNSPVTVVAKSASWSTPAECVDRDRTCRAGMVYRLVIDGADGADDTLRVDASVYKVCFPGDLFPDCAQKAGS